MSKTGFISTKTPRKRRPILWLAPLLALIVVTIVVVTVTLTQANVIMRQPPKALDPFAINILPRFEPVSFTSLDEQTRLSGWLIKTFRNPARGTIVLVHDQGQNRLPYGLDTADLFRFFTDEGFQVLTFDLRASGSSGGDLASFGYMESEDVVKAIQLAKRFTSSNRILLFGIGSGNAALLSAYHMLPDKTKPEIEVSERISDLDIYQQDIAGVLLDTPAAKGADFIKAAIGKKQPFPLNLFLPTTLPLGVRLSGGNKPEIDLTQLASDVIAPMWITRNNPDPFLDNSRSDPLIDTRLRLYPSNTRVYETMISGHASGYMLNRDAYFNDLRAFFDSWYD
ncbi:MAG TPA: alpha/beta hydrolase [Fastidiosipila sp.]|nr:alpha/beta hydrolase [Fastidiosipila sp.]